MTNNQALTTLLAEAESTYANGDYFASLACLFVATEQALKERMEVSDGNFHKLIEKARLDGKISEDEYRFITELKDYRNRLFHENHYADAFVFDDLIYPIYESETKKLLYGRFKNEVVDFVLGS